MGCVVGVGVSSGASTDEVTALVATLVREAGLDIADVEAIATRSSLASDPRLALGPRVVGFTDDELVAASRPTTRSIGIPARVAETAALLAAGRGHRDARPVSPGRHTPPPHSCASVRLRSTGCVATGRRRTPSHAARGRPT